jgi:hypothetical protein
MEKKQSLCEVFFKASQHPSIPASQLYQIMTYALCLAPYALPLSFQL